MAEETITSALTAVAWAELSDRPERMRGMRAAAGDDCSAPQSWSDPRHASVALANAALPEGDPRKITRAMQDAIRRAALMDAGGVLRPHLEAAAAALDALLPPEPA